MRHVFMFLIDYEFKLCNIKKRLIFKQIKFTSFFKALTIKEDDIKHQEKKIKDIRDKIRQAMSDLEAMERQEDFIDDDADEIDRENGDEQEAPTEQPSITEVKQEADETSTEKATSDQVDGDGDVEMAKAEPKEEEEQAVVDSAPSSKEEPNGKITE